MPQIIQLSGILGEGMDKLAYTFAKGMVKALIKEGMFIKNK